MKLIDASMFLKVAHGIKEFDDALDPITEELIEMIIEEQPEIEAIPVEWIKKFANERAKNEDDEGYWHYWGTDLLQMIEQWKKENES